jgi:DNA invertase Pin-like site-specific DNA recombinase
MNDYIYPPPSKLLPDSEVIAYLRDSGGRNQEESIGQQQRVLEDYCRQYHLILSKVYSESASGRKTKKREQFLEMVASVMSVHKDLRPAGLLLWSYSRFTRADVAEFNHYFYGLIMQGIVIHALIDEIPDGLAGQIVLSVKAYSNASYSIELGKNIKRANADNVEKGYSNGGQPPRGYVVVRELHENTRGGAARIGIKWKLDPELAPLVVLAWQMRAQGKSYGEIIKATGGKIYTNKNTWPTHFRNKSYLGIGKAGDREFENHHEPLITWELWDAVRKIEKVMPRHGVRGDPMHPRRQKHPSLLSSLAFCIHCGAAMILHTSKDYRNYICGDRDRKKGFTNCPKARCVNTRKADRIILDTVLNRILSPVFVEDLLVDIQSQMIDTSKIDREIGEANNLLLLTERSITRLLQLVESAGNIEEVGERLKKLKQEKVDHTARIRALKAERESETPKLTPEVIPLVFEAWRTKIQNAYQDGDLLIAKKLIACFVSKIELGNDTAIIRYNYPIAIPAENNNFVSAH